MAAALDVALDWWDSMFAAGMGEARAVQVRSALVAAAAADPPTEGTERAFVLASGMNALYDSFLADGLAPDASFSSVRATIRAPFEDPEGLMDFLRFRFGVDPEQPGEAFYEAAVRAKERGEQIWGPAFDYVQEVLDADHSFVHVTRCYFNDFMTRVGRLELATIICEIDILFADELNKPQYGIQFERPTAMAMGGDCCRF